MAYADFGLSQQKCLKYVITICIFMYTSFLNLLSVQIFHHIISFLVTVLAIYCMLFPFFLETENI